MTSNGQTCGRGVTWGLALGSAFLSAALLLLLTQRYGPATLPDSAGYVAMARSLLEGRGFLNYDGQPVGLWPPLYSLLLAGAARVCGLDLLAAARLLGAGAAAAAAALGALTALRVMRTRVMAGLVSVLFATSAALLLVQAAALSEALFIPLVAGLLFCLCGPLESRRLHVALLVCGLAALTRYLGLFLAAAPLLLLLLSRGGRETVRRAPALLAVAVAAFLPLAAWLARNAVEMGQLTGPRSEPAYGVATALGDVLLITGGFFAPERLGWAAGTSVLLCAALLVGQGWRARRDGAAAPDLALVSLWLVYVAALVALCTSTYVDRIDYRLLAPVFLATLLIVGRAAEQLWLRGLGFRLVLVLVLLAVAGLHARRTVALAQRAQQRGLGLYTDAAWAESPLVAQLRTLPPGPLASNAPDAIYLLTGRPVRMLPLAGRPAQADAEVEGHVAWFRPFWRTYTVTPDDLARTAGLELVARVADGEMYRVRARAAAASSGSD